MKPFVFLFFLAAALVALVACTPDDAAPPTGGTLDPGEDRNYNGDVSEDKASGSLGLGVFGDNPSGTPPPMPEEE